MCKVIQKDPEIMGGTPVFQGTRVPISTFFDYLSETDANDNPITDFLEDFPSVKPKQVEELLEYYKSKASNCRDIACRFSLMNAYPKGLKSISFNTK